MKKNYKSFLLALCLIIPFALIFISCGEDKHEHTYLTEWSNDETYHWHEATCGHGNEKGEYGLHEYGNISYVWNNDYTQCIASRTCLVCSYEEKEITNATKNVTQNKSCDVDELSTMIATFSNSAFTTQTKQNVKTDEETGHLYSSDWSYDSSKHYHVATCGHDLRLDEESHDFNYQGICSICNYDSCSSLSLGHTFDDNTKGTEKANLNTIWYTKVSLTSGTSYMASCANINQYRIKICDKDGTQLYEFGKDGNNFYQFNASYTGDYFITILKTVSGNYKPIFYIASVQDMTSPFNSESESNFAQYSAGEFKAFKFTLDVDCTIKFNGAFGIDDYMEIIASDMQNIFQSNWINNFQTFEDLSAGTYYFVDYYATKEATINYYLVCEHNFVDDNICDVCGYTCSHSTTNAYAICDECGMFLGHTDVVPNGDFVYPDTSDGDVVYGFTLTEGTYKIIEELGTDCTGYNYYLYAKGAGNSEYLNKGSLDPKTITITESGIYYLVVEDEYFDYENEGNSFKIIEDITSKLITNSSYIATSLADSNTYYYIINIATAGVYTFTYDDDIEEDEVNLSIIGQNAIDGCTDYKLLKGSYILQVDVEKVVNDNIIINCGYSQCIVTDGSLTQNLNINEKGKVYFQMELEEGDYAIRTGSTLSIISVFKLGGCIVVSSDSFFNIDEDLGAGTYYIVAYSDEYTTEGAFGIQ